MNKKIWIGLGIALVLVLGILYFAFYHTTPKQPDAPAQETQPNESIDVSEEELDKLRPKPGSAVDSLYRKFDEEKKEFEASVDNAYEEKKVSTQTGDMNITTKEFRDFEIYTKEGGSAVFNIETGNYAHNEEMKMDVRPYVESTGQTSILLKDTLGFTIKPREEFQKHMFLSITSANRIVGVKAEGMKYLNYDQSGELEIATSKDINIIYNLQGVPNVESLSIFNPNQWATKVNLYPNGAYIEGNFMREYSFIIKLTSGAAKEIRINENLDNVTILFEGDYIGVYTNSNDPVEDYIINDLD